MMFESLIAQGLVKQKRYDNGLSVFKYSRKVFYDALWNTDPLLLEARGMVLDDEGNKVICPFTKVFNYGENGAGLELTPETKVVAPRKVNGFMAACRYWNGELIVSTTGSLDSDFAVLARKYVEKLQPTLLEALASVCTVVFEICDPSDPHIIEEEAGAYLIGARCMEGAHTGSMMPEASLDDYAYNLGALRPEVFRGTFGELWEQVKTCKHEGWMVIDATTRQTVCKIKSPHYLSKKFLMRMSAKNVERMFGNKEEFLKTIDEEFYPVVHYITRWWDATNWNAQPDQQRRHIIEEYFEKESQ